ncbi:DUF2399 domain-containing protein [Candidatus Burkholderia verschuerenii]|uniref:DUF2399 domain-containing protein n=1 Tax=Candidatus Burkholderia verschuerenii TaxID=242163 RepID=UPI00067E080B|nr:DUF2399 domain-containing protein [Candidatus Burkholderia verschuerenii]
MACAAFALNPARHFSLNIDAGDNLIMRIWNASPWRFSSADYDAAVALASPERHELIGKPVGASWDAALSITMER